MANWFSNLLGGGNTAETAVPVVEAVTAPVVATNADTAPQAQEAPAGKKKIRLRFGKIDSRQLKEMAQETLKSGGLDIPDTPPAGKKDKDDRDDKRDGQKGGGAGGSLAGVFNNAAQANRASSAMKRRPSAPRP